MRQRRGNPAILALTFLSGLLLTFGVFLYWMFTVLLPVTILEMQYQYRSLLQEVFHTDSLRGVFIPSFRFDLRGRLAKNTENGIFIPKVLVDAPIIYNVDPNDEKAYTAALKLGIAHASGTALPDNGGLGYYFAHSTTPNFVSRFNAVFYLLGKLVVGDEVYVWHNSKRYIYKVSETKFVNPSDVSFLSTRYDKETIVMQTCWPPGTSQQRLLVFAQRSE